MAALIACAPFLRAQSPANASHTAIVMPFENASGAPGIEWIGEAFPEVLGQRLGSQTLYVLNRDDRLRAYDRMGIPAEVHPSRATIYRVAEQMDLDFVVLGRYTFDGQSFRATAQLLDMNHKKLLPEVSEAGPLVELINVQSALAWDLLHSLRANVTVSKQAFVAAGPPIRLDAFENYIRGTVATAGPERVRHLREAVRLNPSYPQAWLQLGKTYYDERQYDQAIAAFGQVPPTDAAAREANFYLGLSAYYLSDYSRAEAAFNFVATRLPLTEVFNNLGVISARRGKKNETEFFQKAVQQDPNDADYHFNLGVALYRGGDLAGATRELRQCLTIHPGDAEARSLLDQVAGGKPASATSAPSANTASHTPLERIRRNYDESTFRQLFVELQSAAEVRLSKLDPATHAQFHVGRGYELLSQGFAAEAEKEFREATTLSPGNAEAHAGLARALEAANDLAGARSEAEAALRLKPLTDPLLVLARLDLRDNRTEAAVQSVDRALQLEPNNAAALALKRAVAAKLAEKAQPLPNR